MNQPQLDPDQIFNRLTGSIWKYAFETTVADSKDPNKRRSGNILFLIIVAILAYAGVEAAKLLFRKNFGKKGISITRMVLSIIAFLIISGITFYYYTTFTLEDASIGSKESFLYTAIFYIVLSGYILFRGINSISKNPKIEAYRGDSYLLGFLMKGKKGWSQSLVQNLAEPLLLLAFGIFFTGINLFWGIPLIFCAISCWVHLLLETIVGLVKERNYLSDKRGYFDQEDFVEAMSA